MAFSFGESGLDCSTMNIDTNRDPGSECEHTDLHTRLQYVITFVQKTMPVLTYYRLRR